MNPTAIEDQLKLLLLQWIVIIAAAWSLGRLGKRWFNQPLAVGEIAAGILLGPSALGAIWPHDWPAMFPKATQPSLQLLGQLGLVFLLFQVGMEFDFSHLRSKSRTVTAVSICGMAAPMLCGLAIGPWLHERFASETSLFGFQFFLCIALSISALPIMGRILLEMKLERTPIGVMAISAAAIDDVAGWVLLGMATAMISARFETARLLGQLAGVAVFFLALHLVVGPWLRRLWRRCQHQSDDGEMSASFLVLLLIGLYLSCLVTHELGIFVIFGAFLFGTALHQETSLARAWRNRFSDMVMVAFVPVFFTNTGLNTTVGALRSPVAWLACAVVLLAAVAGKLGGCYLGARLTGQSAREAACVAALMNTRALMGLIAINIGRDLGLLTPALFTMLVIMALFTTAMCGPLLRWWLPK